MARLHPAVLALALVAGWGAVEVSAQSPAPSSPTTAAITASDIARLQDSVYLAERDISQLRSRNASMATSLQGELDDLRDEVVYLKVKLRKERSLARGEYTDVRDRIESLRTRARGDAASTSSAAPRPSTAQPSPAANGSSGRNAGQPSGAPSPTATTGSGARPSASGTAGASGSLTLPTGTELDVRLQNTLNSGTVQVEDRFEGTTIVDLIADGRTLVPAGSVLHGIVSAVEPATRTNRTARMTLSFDLLTIDGRDYPIRGTVTQAIEGEGIKGEAGRIGAGAGVGAIIGGILGGFKGALAGILIGGGGIVAATEGKEIELPQGTVLRVRIDSPVDLAPPGR
jgi:hypothetical protein